MELLPTARLLELLLGAWEAVGQRPAALQAMLTDVMRVCSAANEGLLDRDPSSDNFSSSGNAATLGHAVEQECARRGIPDLINSLTLLASCSGNVALAVTCILLMHKHALSKPAAVWAAKLYKGSESQALAAGALLSELLRAQAAGGAAAGSGQ